MTQQECEDAIKAKILEIRDIAKSYMGDELKSLSTYYSIADSKHAEYCRVTGNSGQEVGFKAIDNFWFDGEPIIEVPHD